jgi:hypothetical protein
MSEFDPKDFPIDPGDRQIPATIALGPVVDRKVKAAAETIIKQNNWPTELITEVSTHGLYLETSRLKVTIDEVDELEFFSANAFGNQDRVILGVNLFSDNSPCVFEVDLENTGSDLNIYEIVCFPELPPFILSASYDTDALRRNWNHSRPFDYYEAYLEAARAGTMPPVKYLKEEEAQSVLLAFNEVDLVEAVDTDYLVEDIPALQEL